MEWKQMDLPNTKHCYIKSKQQFKLILCPAKIFAKLSVSNIGQYTLTISSRCNEYLQVGMDSEDDTVRWQMCRIVCGVGEVKLKRERRRRKDRLHSSNKIVVQCIQRILICRWLQSCQVILLKTETVNGLFRVRAGSVKFD